MVLGLPLYDIAIGGAPDKGEMRGHAHGIVAIGGIARGGRAVGFIAVGGLAVGYYAAGGAAYGKHVISALQRSPEAVELFSKLFSLLPLR